MNEKLEPTAEQAALWSDINDALYKHSATLTLSQIIPVMSSITASAMVQTTGGAHVEDLVEAARSQIAADVRQHCAAIETAHQQPATIN